MNRKHVGFQYNEDARSYKAISLFAGAGGCSLGFSRYGIDILGAYDIWDAAVEADIGGF